MLYLAYPIQHVDMAWKLQIGTHRGTKQSRDTEVHTTKYDSPHEVLHTLDEVKECAKEWAAQYAHLGYSIWFAHAISPDGQTISNILPSTPYRK
jgi:hypothetical protein